MNKLILVLSVLCLSTSALARDVYVHGYTRSNGAYVESYHRSAPDHTTSNNYGSYGNLNPYSGNIGTRQERPSYGWGGNGLYNPNDN